jgi:DNA-directed DNA polymerase III PolC
MTALALTDHRWLCGMVEFYDACREREIQPLLGLEVPISSAGILKGSDARADRLVVLAQNMAGWGNLCRISSLLQANQSGALPGLSLNELRPYSENLVCLTGGKRGWLAELLSNGQMRLASQWLSLLREIFSDRLYAEIQSHTAKDQDWVQPLAELCYSVKLPLVATHAVDYISAQQGARQRLVSAIRLNTTLYALPAEAASFDDAYLLSEPEMAARLGQFPEALSATQEITARCAFDLPVGKAHFPVLDLGTNLTPIQSLRQKAEAGAAQLYGKLTPEIQARLEHELEVIQSLSYESLFLIVEDILSYARRQGVPVSSRGSAASSLVAHCLGITSPDPIRLNLYFERFLNPARATPPDIDTDLCSRRRDLVLQYVYERFGDERVAMVNTINCFRRRSALRETAKAYGLSSSQISQLTEALPSRWYGPPERLPKDQTPYAELMEHFKAPPYPAIFHDAEALIGLPDHLSIHPGGIVIAPGVLQDLVPTQMATKGIVATQFDLDSIERMGLVKIDLLGIRGLTVLGDVAEAVRLESSSDQTAPLQVLDTIPEQDALTSEMIRTGRTIGCFQIESPGMRATLKEIQARTVDDLMAALALYRPGPLTGGLKDAYVRRHRGEEPTRHIHPALAALLEDTYGVILYQEQVLRIAHELAGLSLADADLLRRAMSHFDPGKQLQTLQEKFILNAQLRSGIPEEIGARIWEMMAAFAGYGFPKAHAASYAQVAWRAAWCKVHYPAVFITAVLANWGGYYSQRVYLLEARRMGLTLRPPLVNAARREFSLQYQQGLPVLYMGLDQVKELTQRSIERILSHRPFHSLDDFLTRVDPRLVEAENLARCGALEGFGSLLAQLDYLQRGGWQGKQLSLFSFDAAASVEDWSIEQKAAAQLEILGSSLIAHPLELKATQIAAAQAMTTVEAASCLGKRVRVAGMRQVWRRSMTARGDTIYFMSLEDLEGMLDVVIFGDVYRRCRRELEGSGPFVVEGLMEFDDERSEPTLRSERIFKI